MLREEHARVPAVLTLKIDCEILDRVEIPAPDLELDSCGARKIQRNPLVPGRPLDFRRA